MACDNRFDSIHPEAHFGALILHDHLLFQELEQMGRELRYIFSKCPGPMIVGIFDPDLLVQFFAKIFSLFVIFRDDLHLSLELLDAVLDRKKHLVSQTIAGSEDQILCLAHRNPQDSPNPFPQV